MKQTFALALLIAMGLLYAACDPITGFTVVNDTNQPITSWLMLENCDDVIGNKGEYDHERTIPPGQQVDIFHLGQSATGSCVQAVTEDRLLILSEPYELDRIYIVAEPIEPGVFVPLEEDLPASSIWEGLSEQPPIFYIFAGLIGFGLLGGLGYAVYDRPRRKARERARADRRR